MKQPKREEIIYYLLEASEGALLEGEGGGGALFSESNKRCAGETLALQTELQMFCSNCGKRPALKSKRACFQRGAAVRQKAEEINNVERIKVLVNRRGFVW